MKVSVKLVRRGSTPTFRIKNARGAFDFLRGLARGLDREHFWRLDLDSRGGFLGYEVVSIGSLDTSIVHPREVFKGAFLNNAHHIIVAHNHPSQNPEPSKADRLLTGQLCLVGGLMDVELSDHLILTDDRYFSFKEAGLF
jgi:DNA repair protein RadC